MKISFFPVFALFVCAAPAFADVTVSSPSGGTTVSSPFMLTATASSCSSQPIASMGYSVDGSTSTSVVYSTSINAQVSAPAGAHTLHVKSWGNKGASCVTDVPITVAAAAPAPAPPTASSTPSVTVTSPASGASVSTPFPLIATAAQCSSQPVLSMGYSFDTSTNTTVVNGTALNTQVTGPVGAHTLHVKSWGKGTGCVTDVPITITESPTANVPPDAVAIAGVHTLNNWKAAFDTGTGNGSATGAMSLVGSPSLSGTARQFVTSYTNYGGERYSVDFGSDPNATNFLYDGWVYLAGPSDDVANLELDLNQVMPNGQTAIYGFQCSGWSNTWEYTANTGTPQKPVPTWLKSTASCNPRNWAIDAWHHVQVLYSRDDSGNVTYQSVWLDGAKQEINETVPSAFALGWAPGALVTNFQVDGIGTSGSAVAYLDNLTVYRW